MATSAVLASSSRRSKIGVDRQADPGLDLAVAHQIEPALGRGPGEQRAVGQLLDGEDLGIVQTNNFAGRESGFCRIHGRLEDPAIGARAEKPLPFGRRLDAPEERGGRRPRQVGQDGTGDQTAVGPGRQTMEVTARNLPVKIDLHPLGERIGGERLRGGANAEEAKERAEPGRRKGNRHEKRKGRRRGRRPQSAIRRERRTTTLTSLPGKKVAFPERQERRALLEAGFVRSGGDPGERAGQVRRRFRLVGEEGGTFDHR